MPLSYSFTVTNDITLITLGNIKNILCFTAEIFKKLFEKGINVDMISHIPQQATQGEIRFTIRDKDLGAALSVISDLRILLPEIKSTVCSNNSKIVIYSPVMNEKPGIAFSVLKALASCDADLRLITTAESEISLLMPSPCAPSSLLSLEQVFNGL